MSYDSKGKLTRAGAVAVINGKGSVSIGNRVYSRIEELPGEAEFAKGDKEQEAAALARLQAERDAIDAQIKSLPKPVKVEAAPLPDVKWEGDKK